MISRILAAGSLIVLSSAAEAQSIASRVNAVRDGKVRMTFASREDICGFNGGMSRGKDNHMNWSGGRKSEDVEYDVRCSEGPARIVVQKSGGSITKIEAYVGGRWRPASVTDLGDVGVRDATSWLLDVAAKESGKVAGNAIFATTLADSVDMTQPLYQFARNDSRPQEAREQAIFWLGQLPDESAVGLLERILRDSRESSIKDKAIFALSQHQSGRGMPVLRDFATSTRESEKLRGQAIFWLGQRRGESTQFLRNLYSSLDSEELKDKVIFSLSQQKGANDEWLLDLVSNSREPMEMRKKALFWAGQTGAPMSRLASIYSRTTEREMKEQMIFVFSQRREAAAFDKLMDIARNDPDRDARRKAMFWLGQSKDPRVASMLSDIINR
jgi:HEAT repeat protein